MEDDGELAQFCPSAGAPLPCVQGRAEDRLCHDLYTVLRRHRWTKAIFAKDPLRRHAI